MIAFDDFIRRLPKAERHIPIDGRFEPELRFEVTRRNRERMPFDPVEAVRPAHGFEDLQSVMGIHYLGVSVLLEDSLGVFPCRRARRRAEHGRKHHRRPHRRAANAHTESLGSPGVHARRGTTSTPRRGAMETPKRHAASHRRRKCAITNIRVTDPRH